MNRISKFMKSEDKEALLTYLLRVIRFKLLHKRKFASVGNNSYIESIDRIIGARNVFLGNDVYIGNHTRIEAHSEWNGKKYKPSIVFGDNVSIGQGFHIAAMGQIVIGQGTVISGNVLVTDLEHEYRDIDLSVSRQDILWKHTSIGENCFIGYGAVIQSGTELGNHCIVGSNAVLKGKYPDYCVLVGVPARIVKKYNFSLKKWEKYKE